MGDLIGAICGHISGKDSRGGKALPVYKGKLDTSLKEDKPKGEKTEKQKQMDDYLKKYGGGGDDKGEKKLRRKKKKPKTSAGGNVKIIDEEEGCEGIALAKAKGALRMSDEELSDEEAVMVDYTEIQKREEEEKKRSMVQVGDGGDGGSKWVEVDEDGNVLKDCDAGASSRKGPSGDLSPPRKRARSEDLSPPRRKAADSSPPRRGGRHDSPDSDQSPPRRGAGGGGKGSPSPPRRRAGGSPDQSPPRRGRGGGGDASPPRRRRNDTPDSDQSPPRRGPQGGGGGSKGDSSPPRRKRHDSDSPPRRTRHDSDSEGEGGAPPQGGKAGLKTVNGLRAGFVSGKELNDTMDKKRAREDDKFKALNDEETGRVAVTVYRDKSGKRVQEGGGKLAKAEQEEKEEQEMKNMVWGKGLVQQEEQLEHAKRVEKEKSMPFSRRADDKEMNEGQKAVQRWGDPMAGKIKSAPTAKPKYRGAFPPNRFGIPPGYRWDGVNRSNGFESKWFASRNERATLELAAHAWSTEAM